MSASRDLRCERIQEAIAAGETLFAADADHLKSCIDCGGIAEAARRAGELLPDRSAELAQGFRARLLVGGRARNAARTRRRHVTVGLGAAAALGAALWMAMPLGSGHRTGGARAAAADGVSASAARSAGDPAEVLPSQRELDALLAPAARWDFVEEPLAPYRMLAESMEASDRDPGGSP